MKLPLLATLFFVFALTCAAQPLRVLYLGTPDRTPRMNAHVLMRDLGRDAIWFDYVYDPAAATPAFVAKLPPIVQLPSAAKLRGNNLSAPRAASWTDCTMHPASTVIVSLSVSIDRTLFKRARQITTACPVSSGVAPPHILVLPPEGTIGVLVETHTLTTAATSWVDAGRKTASA